MSTRGAVAAVAFALLAAGVVLGLVPRSVHGVNCGSALRGSGEVYVATLIGEGGANIQGECGDARSAMRVPTIGLLVVGAALMLGVVVTGQPRPSRPQQA